MKLAHKLVPEGLITGTPPPNVTGGTKCKNPFPASQNNFSAADIDKIEIYLDHALQDKSIGSKCRVLPTLGFPKVKIYEQRAVFAIFLVS